MFGLDPYDLITDEPMRMQVVIACYIAHTVRENEEHEESKGRKGEQDDALGDEFAKVIQLAEEQATSRGS